ncbi:TetR/AcrR family transcriptional regulator [Luteimicrobium subarcticum]|uniref:TetR family transcriptional regulator n=1 Tax=Luteimicrobium subarcticum TaxID=620910 RepID=A0A2M8WSS7_9MICO|nr:TetR/AcrR family transcriptional regulator [Luteimicrobium subarcticum]PJI93970.1 TetR family transcriptional regulator [Luteimicrobium subarcticum]
MTTQRLSHDERREQLADAAMQIALREGVEAVTIRTVARAAGVRPGIVHYCFADKHDLLAAMASRTSATAASYLEAAMEAGSDVPSRLHALADALWQTLEARHHYQLLLFEIATLGARDDRLREVALAQQREQWAASEEYLGRSVALSGMRFTLPHAAVARFVSAQIDGIQIAWMIDHDDAAAQRSFHAVADVLATLVEPVPADEPRVPEEDGTGEHADGSAGEPSPR